MDDDIKALLILLLISSVCCSIFGLGFGQMSKNFKIDEFLECQEQTQNQDWCITKFLR